MLLSRKIREAGIIKVAEQIDDCYGEFPHSGGVIERNLLTRDEKLLVVKLACKCEWLCVRRKKSFLVAHVSEHREQSVSIVATRGCGNCAVERRRFNVEEEEEEKEKEEWKKKNENESTMNRGGCATKCFDKCSSLWGSWKALIGTKFVDSFEKDRLKYWAQRTCIRDGIQWPTNISGFEYRNN